MNIIILDNHKLIIAEIKRQVLAVLPGAECVCFTKQREAIEHVKKHRVDVALLDIDMPGLNGIEVAELMCDANPRLSALGDATFFNCTSLESFTVPASVKAIPNNCFSGCRSLESVSMPASLTNIGQNAFLDCALLSSVKFGSGLRKIEASAFSGCRSLDEVTLPSGTTGIGASAFSGCSSLRMITIPASVTNIGTKAFEGCRNLVIDCPKGSVAEQYAVKNHIELANNNDVTYNDDTRSE